MQDDERCCGSGTCIIDANGLCWCGQRWVGNQLCQNDVLASSQPVNASPQTVDLNSGDDPA